MKILFFSRYFSPHVGGVEKHLYLLSRELVKKGYEITVLTEKFDSVLRDREIFDSINIIRFDYPHKKIIGIFYIWYFLWKNRDLLVGSDVIHIHDVFIWYLPFRFIFPTKKVFTTIHGLEWGNPFSFSGVMQKKVAVKLSTGTIGVGKFLEKYLKVKFDLITYGATKIARRIQKEKNRVVFVGRLSRDTGVLKFIKWLENHKNLKVDFVGGGELKEKCEIYGKVHGFTNPEKFLMKASYCISGGYLSCLEAFSYKCRVKVFWQDQLKKDYWKLSPMYKFIEKEDVQGAYEWVKEQNWKKMADNYIKIWNI